MPTIEEIESKIGDSISAADYRKLFAQTVEVNTETVENVSELVEEIKEVTNIIKDAADEDNSGAEAEKERENIEILNEQTELLEKIEENTKGGDKKKTEEKSEDSPSTPGFFSTSLGGLLGGFGGAMSGLMGGLGISSLVGVAKTGLLGLLKFTLIPFLTMGVVNGLMDGWKEYKESGDLGDAIIAGLGGLTEVLTLGLINEESIKKIVSFFNDYWDRVEKDFKSLGQSLGFIDKENPLENQVGKYITSFEDPTSKTAAGSMFGGFSTTDAAVTHQVVRDENGKVQYKDGKVVTKEIPVNMTGRIMIDPEYVNNRKYIITKDNKDIIVDEDTYEKAQSAIERGSFSEASGVINDYVKSGKTPDKYDISKLPKNTISANDIENQTKEIQRLESAAKHSAGLSVNAPVVYNNSSVQTTNNPPVSTRDRAIQSLGETYGTI